MPTVLTVERSLIAYLEALGAHRAAAQMDPQLPGRWTVAGYVLDVDRDELVAHLMESWVPSPIVSPWNGGSGFYAGDNTRGIDWIRESASRRLQPYRDTIAAAEQVLRRLNITAKPAKEDKPRIVAALRAAVPDEAVPWLDAAVPHGSQPGFRFNALLGTGGNNGRWEMSNNVMRALSMVFGGPGDRSRAWLADALFGEPAELADLSYGHLGDTDLGGNPWTLLLAAEGALLFASSAPRRLDTTRRPVGPFVADHTRAGYSSAAPAEEVLAEFWAPYWEGWATVGELAQVFAAGQVTVISGTRPRVARTGYDHMRAAADRGWPPGIVAADRWIIARRHGQAYTAVLAR